ncbi:MAG TPA: hypothetical protein VNR60_13255 [Croceibacterium sp.]|nr:hypothetical protein [Croceibacterium sp.]
MTDRRISIRALVSLPAVAALALAAVPLAAQAPGEDSAVRIPACDRECLIDLLRDHMKALTARDPSLVKLADNVRFTENNVFIPVGTGLWNTVTAVDAEGLEAADPSTGNAAWFGSVKENGQPAIYAVRIHVSNGAIDEIETVVHRKTALPAPFGDVENMVHDAEFNQILPPEQRRSRERMLAIADSYFDTVEVNDGQVFAPFSEDCGRLENGISTTAPTPGASGAGNATAIASGCREQFELGIYRINKRVRRDFFIVDEERGVAVGRGFFDHANEWDRYLLTNGREMRTALKWPNSITLLEAFRIKDAKIQRIEAVFTYVPYFMNNPFWGPHASPPAARPDPAACDTACVAANTQAVMSAYPVRGQWATLPWADKVGYAENSVGIRVNEGIWQGVTAVDSAPLVVADARTGNGVWVGRIEEHGQPAWAAITVRSAGRQIDNIDAVIRRKEYGMPYAEPNGAPQYSTLPAARRTTDAAMRAGAERFYAAFGNPGQVPQGLADNCRWFVNGQDLGECAPSFSGPGLASIERVRDREVLAVDEARGLIIYRTFEDVPAKGSGYPLTYQVVELFRFEGGKITEVQAWNSELPFGMVPHR